MAHMMNLAFKIVSKFPLVSKVEELVCETHAYFVVVLSDLQSFNNLQMILQMEKTIKRC